MGEVAVAMAVPHTPLLWRLLRGDPPEDLVAVAAALARFRGLLEEARPDAMVVVASDHFRQLTTSLMPAFMVGKAPDLRGTHPNEERAFGLPAVSIPGHLELAAAISSLALEPTLRRHQELIDKGELTEDERAELRELNVAMARSKGRP